VPTELATSASISLIEQRIAPLRAQLASHPLYTSIRTEDQLDIFMRSHVFAVWDFMSLLKALQTRLTCTSVPWLPSALPESRRFINEIVLGEESDMFEGRAISHFELYLEAMQEAHADTRPIEALLAQLQTEDGRGDLHLALAKLPAGPRAFTSATFRVIEQGRLHTLAAAFTFGREDLIPDMFRALVQDLNQRTPGRFATFLWYLERHIEVDGDDHGPLSLRMIENICGTDEILWEEAATAAEQALQARIAFWDAILAEIQAR
jgi:hypothetical protein